MRLPASAAGRGRPPQAAGRRAGLEGVEKSVSSLNSTDTTERNAGMLRSRRRWWSWLLAGHGDAEALLWGDEVVVVVGFQVDLDPVHPCILQQLQYFFINRK